MSKCKRYRAYIIFAAGKTWQWLSFSVPIYICCLLVFGRSGTWCGQSLDDVTMESGLATAYGSTLPGILGNRFSIHGLSNWVRRHMAKLSTDDRAPIRAQLEKQDALSVDSAAGQLRMACKDRDIFLSPDGEWLARISGLDIGLVEECYREQGGRMPHFLLEHFRKKAMPDPIRARLQEKLAYQRSKMTPRQLKLYTEFQPVAEQTRRYLQKRSA
jgi:hypothetical protein